MYVMFACMYVRIYVCEMAVYTVVSYLPLNEASNKVTYIHTLIPFNFFRGVDG